MAKTGRRSAASLGVAPVAPLETIKRPSPPAELTVEQAAEWRAVVSRMAPEWFPRETHGLLATFCRHVVAARRVARLIETCVAAEPINVDQFDQLLRLQERESRAISSLATRMRITQQATVHKSRQKPEQSPSPWEG